MTETKTFDLSYYEDYFRQSKDVIGFGYGDRKINVIPLVFLFDNDNIPNEKLKNIKEGDIIDLDGRFSKYLVIKYRADSKYYSDSNPSLVTKMNKYKNFSNNDLCLLKFTYDDINEVIFIPLEGMEFDINYTEIDECEGQIIDLHYLKKVIDSSFNINDLSNETYGFERLLVKRNDEICIFDCSDEIKEEFEDINDILLPIMKENDKCNNISHIMKILENIEDRIISKGINFNEFTNTTKKNNISISKMKKNELLELVQKLQVENESLKLDAESMKNDIEEKNNNIEILKKEKKTSNRDILDLFFKFKKEILKNVDNIEKMIKNNN